MQAIKDLGAAGAIFHAHAKDTRVDAANVRRNGVLDTKGLRPRAGPLVDCSAPSGTAHGESAWRDIVSALRIVGYDGVLSIEHEDLLASVDEGLERAVALLRAVVLREPPAEMWWS